MDQNNNKLNSQNTEKRLRSEETEKIEYCIDKLQKAYDSTRETKKNLKCVFKSS